MKGLIGITRGPCSGHDEVRLRGAVYMFVIWLNVFSYFLIHNGSVPTCSDNGSIAITRNK